MKFSIIVPAYNAEKYLTRCLDSLLCQDLPAEEYEIVVVNDGSVDKTTELLDAYSQKAPNIKSFTTENRGVSEARNYGCIQSVGEYFVFVDADDWIKPNTLSLLYDKMEGDHLDLLVMDYRFWNSHGELPQALHFSDKCKQGVDVCVGTEFMQRCLPPVVWSIVYRSAFWKEHDFHFLPIRHEDEELVPRVFYFASRVAFLPLDFYNYYQNQDSFMMNYDEHSCIYMLRAMESLENFRLKYVKEDRMNIFFQNLIARNLLKALKRSIQWSAPITIQLEMVSEMKKKGLTPLPKGKSFFYTCLYFLSPTLFIYYYRIKLKKV